MVCLSTVAIAFVSVMHSMVLLDASAWSVFPSWVATLFSAILIFLPPVAFSAASALIIKRFFPAESLIGAVKSTLTCSAATVSVPKSCFPCASYTEILFRYCASSVPIPKVTDERFSALSVYFVFISKEPASTALFCGTRVTALSLVWSCVLSSSISWGVKRSTVASKPFPKFAPVVLLSETVRAPSSPMA